MSLLVGRLPKYFFIFLLWLSPHVIFLVVMLYERGFRIEVGEKRTSNTREDSREFILNLIVVYI